MITVVAAGTASLPRTHVWHLLGATGFLITALVAILVVEFLGRLRGAGPALIGAALRRTAALSAAGAGLVHLVVIPEHLREGALYGAFFILTAGCQLVFSAAVLARPTRALLSIGVAGNASLVLLWGFSRLVAVPVGPSAGTTEPFGILDILASSCELVFIASALLLLRRALSSVRQPPVQRAGPRQLGLRHPG